MATLAWIAIAPHSTRITRFGARGDGRDGLGNLGWRWMCALDVCSPPERDTLCGDGARHCDAALRAGCGGYYRGANAGAFSEVGYVGWGGSFGREFGEGGLYVALVGGVASKQAAVNSRQMGKLQVRIGVRGGGVDGGGYQLGGAASDGLADVAQPAAFFERGVARAE